MNIKKSIQEYGECLIRAADTESTFTLLVFHIIGIVIMFVIALYTFIAWDMTVTRIRVFIACIVFIASTYARMYYLYNKRTNN